MITWILILTITYGGEGAIHSIDFGTYEECQEAADTWMSKSHKWKQAICVPSSKK